MRCRLVISPGSTMPHVEISIAISVPLRPASVSPSAPAIASSCAWENSCAIYNPDRQVATLSPCLLRKVWVLDDQKDQAHRKICFRARRRCADPCPQYLLPALATRDLAENFGLCGIARAAGGRLGTGTSDRIEGLPGRQVADPHAYAGDECAELRAAC